MAFVTIPLYFVIVYQSENMIRRQSITFGAGSTQDDYTITWENSFSETNGTACVSEVHDNIITFLWIEVISFQCAVLVVFAVTSYYFFVGMYAT